MSLEEHFTSKKEMIKSLEGKIKDEFAIFNKKELKKMLLKHEIFINSKQLNEIYKEFESLSKIAPLWKLNGFSKNELN